MVLELIAHRGGVVNSTEEENTAESLSLAIDDGYYGVEIDVRETADHVAVLRHEAWIGPASSAVHDRPITIETLSKMELIDYCNRLGVPSPLRLEEALAICRGKLKLMIEIKESDPSELFLDSIEESLTQNELWDDLLVIGSAAGKKRFAGRSLVSMRLDEFRTCKEISRRTTSERFLFDHGSRLLGSDVERAISAGMLVVPSVNVFHYGDESNPDADFRKLIDAGPNRFQIDSVYRSRIEAMYRSS